MTPLRLFVILTAVFGSLATYFVPRMDASGDEPHYLVMAQSLWREGDLDLRDNYEREDWREFRGGPTDPHYGAPRKDGRPFPGHAPGLPFLLAPIYALGGRLACVLFLGAMVAAVGALAFWIANREGLSAGAALLAGALASGPPLAAFALHVYTEAPSALALFSAYGLLRFGHGAWAAGLAAAIACALPFLHPRMAVTSLAIAFAAFVFRDRASLRVFVVVAALGTVGYALFWMSIFGSPTSLGVYGGVPEDAAFHPAQALMGLLMDRAYGLAPVAPAFLALLLIGPVAPRTAEQTRRGRVELVLALAILLPVLLWRMWWGGQSPPARLIAPMTPFLALWLARLWDGTMQSRVRRLIGAAVAWSYGLFLFAALQPGRLLFINKRVRPTRLWDALWPGGPIDGLLPDLARPQSSDWIMATAWTAVLIALVFLTRWPRGKAATGLQ
ncbi:MAG: hypothetical protein JJE39_03310 [Vicinamibacteria bacterium]|nr:hypothetical protein [Vicinamibacteria bacterium]